ncbi:hypothetical protein [Haloplanus salilacus]|uniref:hypothetical protein n=1 Tax=Haloplanus salilacus TaxID=2949994 RepID=UPI0030D540A5
MTDDTDDTPTTDTDTEDGAISKRTLIRLLVGFAIGVPLVIEGATFFELFRQQFAGDDNPEDTTDTGTPTPESDAVGVGDDLLPTTDRTETLTEATLREAEGDRWSLSLTVDVTNGGETDYEFQLLSVVLRDGRSISGRTSTDRVPPEESRTVTGEWSIPAGSTPDAVEVVALVYPEDDGSVETIERLVELAKIPVQGG